MRQLIATSIHVPAFLLGVCAELLNNNGSGSVPDATAPGVKDAQEDLQVHRHDPLYLSDRQSDRVSDCLPNQMPLHHESRRDRKVYRCSV